MPLAVQVAVAESPLVGRLLKLLPPSVLTCHCTVGAGVPLAAAVKVALLPAHTVWPVGWVVMPGAALTVRPATSVVTAPHALLNTARYCLPLSPALGVKV